MLQMTEIAFQRQVVVRGIMGVSRLGVFCFFCERLRFVALGALLKPRFLDLFPRPMAGFALESLGNVAVSSELRLGEGSLRYQQQGG